MAEKYFILDQVSQNKRLHSLFESDKRLKVNFDRVLVDYNAIVLVRFLRTDPLVSKLGEEHPIRMFSALRLKAPPGEPICLMLPAYKDRPLVTARVSKIDEDGVHFEVPALDIFRVTWELRLLEDSSPIPSKSDIFSSIHRIVERMLARYDGSVQGVLEYAEKARSIKWKDLFGTPIQSYNDGCLGPEDRALLLVLSSDPVAAEGAHHKVKKNR